MSRWTTVATNGRKRWAAVVAGAALVLTTAFAAAPANADTAQAYPVTMKISPFSATKPASGCKDIFWWVTVSGLKSGTVYKFTSSAKQGTADPITGSLVSYPLKNGSNKVRGYVCSSLDKSGPYKINAAVRVDGKVQGAAEARGALRVTPVLDLNGYDTTSGFYVYGYPSPAIDMKGKEIRIYFKKKGTSTFKVVGKTTVNSSGKWGFKSKAITLGHVYVSYAGSDYVLKARSVTREIVPARSSSATGVSLG
ncbi:hypothetical protein ACT17Q_06115 [Cellulomonas sp. CW35]|uniref:hypothetical protein n=1 Tax=unclassified Cellulomonas TaxID=2620175 RepID=UPI000B8D24DB|nr:hypothetical protein [Cellulomonas sp. PSBB021]ASR54914.1 hypothetical protein CBP52_07115 [Cellulomonas sp. PSBB021]